MGKDQAYGGLLLAGCVLGVIVYGWLVFLTEYSLFVLQLTGFIAVGGILAIGAWIGWTLATTPPPKPLEDLGTEEFEAEKKEEK